MKSIIFLLALVPVIAFGQDVPVEVPAAITALLAFLGGIPGVGPVLAKVILYVGVLSGVLTALVVFVASILKPLELILGAAKLQGASEFVAKVQAKVLPWLKYFSAFNVQKK